MVALNKLVFVLPSLLHYHIPRFRAFANACQKAGTTFTHIELCSRQKAYPWLVEGQTDQFSNVTLFPDQYLEQIDGNRLWSALKSQLETLRPDGLFLYGYSLDVFRKARRWAETQGVATVILSDSNLFDKKRYWLIERLKKRLVIHFDAAFVGGTSSSAYLQSLGFPAERCVTGFDVIDNNFFAQRNQFNQENISQLRQKWHLPEKYFLYVGRMIPEKNLMRLLEAYHKYAAEWKQEPSAWHLVLCGSGSEEGQINKAIQALPASISEKIHLLGHVNQPEVIDLFSCAACFVLPSLSESWGLVINEAMACSLPVLVTNRAGCAIDLVHNNENGWVFDPMDVDQLASLMVAVSGLDSNARAKIGQCGRKIIADWDLERFSRGALESARIALRHFRKEAWENKVASTKS